MDWPSQLSVSPDGPSAVRLIRICQIMRLHGFDLRPLVRIGLHGRMLSVNVAASSCIEMHSTAILTNRFAV